MAKSQGHLKEIYTDLIGSGRIELFIIPEIRFNNKKSDYLYLQYKKYFNDPDLVFNKPGSHLNYIRLQYQKQKTLIHHHWLDCQDNWDFFSVSFKLICLMVYKKLGGRIVWTIHNKKPLHKRYRWFNNYIRSWLANNADRILVHCKSVIPELSNYFNQPESKFRIINHPVFPAEFLNRKEALHRLNNEYDLDLKENDKVFLMFGNINSQKRIEEVCRIFSSLPNNVRLLVAGPVKSGHLKYYRNLKGKYNKLFNINILPNFISENNVPSFFNSADCILFNYKEVLASGGVELAKSYKRPIIAPKCGCIAENSEKEINFFTTQEELINLIQHFEQKEVLSNKS